MGVGFCVGHMRGSDELHLMGALAMLMVRRLGRRTSLGGVSVHVLMWRRRLYAR